MSNSKHYQSTGAGGAVYGLGFFGAVIYFFQHAPNFFVGLFGIVKALVWPGILVYEAFKYLRW